MQILDGGVFGIFDGFQVCLKAIRMLIQLEKLELLNCGK